MLAGTMSCPFAPICTGRGYWTASPSSTLMHPYMAYLLELPVLPWSHGVWFLIISLCPPIYGHNPFFFLNQAYRWGPWAAQFLYYSLLYGQYLKRMTFVSVCVFSQLCLLSFDFCLRECCVANLTQTRHCITVKVQMTGGNLPCQSCYRSRMPSGRWRWSRGRTVEEAACFYFWSITNTETHISQS